MKQQIEGYPLTTQCDTGKECYSFKTAEDVNYDIDIEDAYFMLFEGESFAEDVKMISLEPASGKPALTIDPRIGPTIKQAIDEEIVKNRRLIIVYICSARDQQQVPRARKFGWMFAATNAQNEYIQIKIADGESYGGIIVHRDNSNLEYIKFLVA